MFRKNIFGRKKISTVKHYTFQTLATAAFFTPEPHKTLFVKKINKNCGVSLHLYSYCIPLQSVPTEVKTCTITQLHDNGMPIEVNECKAKRKCEEIQRGLYGVYFFQSEVLHHLIFPIAK